MMQICLIAEGSYPYIAGGVSSWINQLMTNLPQHEFIITAINPDHERDGKYAYSFPANLVLLHDVYLNDFVSQQGKWNKKLPGLDEEQLSRLLLCEKPDWPLLFQSFTRMRQAKVTAFDILLSEQFYRQTRHVYSQKFSRLPFNEVFWTLRSMFFNVFAILLADYPQADLFHAVSTGYAGLAGAFAAYLQAKPFILTEHGIYTREREEEIIKSEWVKGEFKNMWIDFFYLLSDCAYSMAKEVITLFNYNKQIEIELGCPAEKIKVIHNGIDVDKFKAVAQAVAKRPSQGRINVGAVIRVVPIKDIKTMLQAFAQVNQKDTDIHFYIMGTTDEDPDYYAECVSYMEMLDLKNTSFTGRVNIMEALKEIDLLVLTSISEGQPLAILEGLACSLPFVTTNVGDCNDLINGNNDDFGPAGFVVPVMDYAAIADRIIKLAQDGPMRRSYGENGRRRVAEKYSFTTFIDGYELIYQSYS